MSTTTSDSAAVEVSEGTAALTTNQPALASVFPGAEERPKPKREPKVKEVSPAPADDRSPCIGDTVQFCQRGRHYYAAIITMVHSATYVNLYVFPDAYTDPDDQGWAPFARSSVGNDPQTGAHWRWPQ